MLHFEEDTDVDAKTKETAVKTGIKFTVAAAVQIPIYFLYIIFCDKNIMWKLFSWSDKICYLVLTCCIIVLVAVFSVFMKINLAYWIIPTVILFFLSGTIYIPRDMFVGLHGLRVAFEFIGMVFTEIFTVIIIAIIRAVWKLCIRKISECKNEKREPNAES